MYDYLFKPLKINKLEIKNRIAYPSLGLLYSYDTKLNDKYYNFYKEIAKGGAGIVTVGPVGIDFLGAGFVPLSIASDEAIPSFQKLTKLIKDEGASPWVQLFHAGAYTYPFLINNETPIAPSAIFSKYSKAKPKEMTLEDIRAVQTAFADGALRAKKSGFEGVEIIASAGYLITQFLSPLKNLRTDDYGGSFENRIRFVKEILALVREKVGSDYPIGIRMAGNDFVEGSNCDVETPKIAKVYEECGVDIINVTGGWHESKVPQLPMELPRGGFSYLAANIKKEVNIPVMASNRITTPDVAEAIIQDGVCDMVNLGRVLIADPFWPEKAKNGRSEEIRPCVACSQGCTDEIFNGRPVYCVGNPRAGFEAERNIKITDNPKKVMVVGAGISGLEAALTASMAGHSVEIYEKKSEIGGQIKIAAAPPHKSELLEFVRYYRAMLKKYDIPVFLNVEVTTQMINELKPDHIIVCEGAKPLIPPLKGADDPSVISSWDVLEKNPRLGREVAVIGGGAVGLETAFFIAEKGTMNPETVHFLMTYEAATPERIREHMFRGSSSVTVFEMMDKAGADVGKSTKWVLMGNLDRHGVTVKTKCKVLSIKDGVVEYETPDGVEKKKFDNVVMAAGSKAVRTLSKEVGKSGIPYSTVGDCIQPGKMNHAIHGGFLTALEL
jgi:2,4-dienoyl-CoA reductase (NADPH2)